jgi:hypothetical protein
MGGRLAEDPGPTAWILEIALHLAFRASAGANLRERPGWPITTRLALAKPRYRISYLASRANRANRANLANAARWSRLAVSGSSLQGPSTSGVDYCSRGAAFVM